MRINLQEIPEEGKTFIYNQNTQELNEVLKDLIGSTPHQVEMTILPMSSGTFELTGSIKTQLAEQCSRCGEDFKLDFNEKIRELLMPTLDVPRNSKYSKPNHVSDLNESGPSVVEYRGHHFEAGEYVHEVIAITEPVIPYCAACANPEPGQSWDYEDKGFENKPESPFASLKNLKLQ